MDTNLESNFLELLDQIWKVFTIFILQAPRATWVRVVADTNPNVLYSLILVHLSEFFRLNLKVLGKARIEFEMNFHAGVISQFEILKTVRIGFSV
jgi:hypothetical protein